MQTDGRKIAKDLITHRDLWHAALSGESYEESNAVKLRELERKPFISDNLYIGIKEHRKEDFEMVARRWNPVSIQFLRPEDDKLHDTVVELCF